MSLPLSLREDAEAEFDEAFDRYQTESPGLGVAFAEGVNATLLKLSESPKLFPEVFHDIRRAGVDGFPYSVYYRIKPDC
jgi:hypothetical protein